MNCMRQVGGWGVVFEFVVGVDVFGVVVVVAAVGFCSGLSVLC